MKHRHRSRFGSSRPAPVKYFELPNKIHGDPPFDLTPPVAAGSAACTYTSDNLKVARVSASRLTITGDGVARITAAWRDIHTGEQRAATATLTVLPHPGWHRHAGLIWLRPDDRVRDWDSAQAYCGALFGGGAGWRLPTAPELCSFFSSPAYRACDWPANYYWTSSRGRNGHHRVVSAADAEVCENDNDRLLFHVAPVRVNPVQTWRWDRLERVPHEAECATWELVID